MAIPTSLYLAMCPGAFSLAILAYQLILVAVVKRSEFGDVPFADREAMAALIAGMRSEEMIAQDPLRLASGLQSVP